jgi:hypothetical protein
VGLFVNAGARSLLPALKPMRRARIAVLRSLESEEIGADAAIVPRGDGLAGIEDFLAASLARLGALLDLLLQGLRSEGFSAVEACFSGSSTAGSFLLALGPLSDPERWYFTKADDEPDTFVAATPGPRLMEATGQ